MNALSARRILRSGRFSVLVALALAAGFLTGGAHTLAELPVAPTAAAAAAPTDADVRSCSEPVAGSMACDVRTAKVKVSGRTPAQLRKAYRLPAHGGRGRTIAVIVAYDAPRAASDLAVYRKRFGLPACTVKNRCFRKVSQTGSRTRLPAPSAAWAAEAALDLDMVSAIAPRARILLVEARSARTADLGAAVNRAVAMGAKYVSNSYGAPESSGDIASDARYFNHPGVVITASSGDSGYGVHFPATSPHVIAVGGTTLVRSNNARGWAERAWSGTTGFGPGSGCSKYQPKPTWQKDTGCAHRTVADVSVLADPKHGVAMYNSYRAGGWTTGGGTSVGAPIVAAAYAVAGPSYSRRSAATLYRSPWSLNDVSSGSSARCAPSYLCRATTRYDGPTGLGTPRGLAAFR